MLKCNSIIFFSAVMFSWSQKINVSANPKLLLIDSFSEFISFNLKKLCIQRNIYYIEVVYPYMNAILKSQGSESSSNLIVPTDEH
jgi:hypothetical protein